jgi:hypothetical protein
MKQWEGGGVKRQSHQIGKLITRLFKHDFNEEIYDVCLLCEMGEYHIVSITL